MRHFEPPTLRFARPRVRLSAHTATRRDRSGAGAADPWDRKTTSPTTPITTYGTDDPRAVGSLPTTVAVWVTESGGGA